MYVCVCKAVTEKHIQNAVSEGVKHFKALRDRTGIATQCGKCSGDAKNCFRQVVPVPVT